MNTSPVPKSPQSLLTKALRTTQCTSPPHIGGSHSPPIQPIDEIIRSASKSPLSGFDLARKNSYERRKLAHKNTPITRSQAGSFSKYKFKEGSLSSEEEDSGQGQIEWIRARKPPVEDGSDSSTEHVGARSLPIPIGRRN